MKPYLESIRKLARVGLILFALSLVASAVVTIQYCAAPYHYNAPSITQMFSPLIVFIYLGGVVLAMDGFSFLNKRSDSDFYHSLPVSRKKLFWAISLAALTWVAATVLGSVLVSIIIHLLTKTPFVQLYALVAVPFFTIATMMVFSACAIAMSLTGTAITGLGLTILVFGLLRFTQFTIARGIVANTQIIGWLDLPWLLTPVTNIATGQIAQLLRPMLRQTLYLPVNMIYSALVAAAELVIARVLFSRRSSELAEHGTQSAGIQTAFACAAVVPVVMLFSSGIIRQHNVSLPIVIGVAIGIFVIYQLIVLRTARKVLLSLPWVLLPLALGVAGYFGTTGTARAMQNYVPNSQDVAYVQLEGSSRGSEVITYQQYMVSKVRFTDSDMRQYAVETLRDNVATIRKSGYLSYSYDVQTGYVLATEPVTFVLKDGRRFSRVLTFLNQNTLKSYCEQNSEYRSAICALPPQDAVCYLQGVDPYQDDFLNNRRMLDSFYEELPSTGYPANDYYRMYDPTIRYDADLEQNYGALSVSGYVGMTRFWDYYNVRLGTPLAASAWMQYRNEHSKGEYLDVMQQMMEQAASLQGEMDYFNLSLTVYNVPMSDGSKQMMSFYFDRSFGENMIEMKDQLQPYLSELAKIMLRSKPTTNPNDFCVYATWSGRVLKADGTFFGEDVIANQPVTNADGSFVSGGSVYYVSDGNIIRGGLSGAITSYNPCYRSFTPQDQARVIEILQQWKSMQDQYEYTIYGSKPEDGPGIGIDSAVNGN